MIKRRLKQIFYIFIYIVVSGCDSIVGPVCSDCYLNVDVPNLTIDDNGYYHLHLMGSYSQTFTTIRARTGITEYHQKVKWISNKEYY